MTGYLVGKMASNVGNVDEVHSIHITSSTTAQERTIIQASLSEHDISLVIIDTAFDGSSLTLRLLRRTDNIEQELNALPAHGEGFARIFDYSYNFDEQHLKQFEEYVRKVYQHSSKISYSTTAYDLDGIVSQWNSDVPVWLRADDYTLESKSVRDSSNYLRCLPIETNRLLSNSKPRHTRCQG
jgi:hypothetical protein